MSLRVISLTTEYGPVPEITIDRDTRVKVTPHFLSAKRAAEETIPTIAAGQPRLIARVILQLLVEAHNLLLVRLLEVQLYC